VATLERELTGIDFYRYPPIGEEDWGYVYATAQVRVLESQMLTRNTFVDMANAESFAAVAEMLSGTEYSIDTGADSSAIEEILLARRSEVRSLAAELLPNKAIVEMLRAREDFANMRLAVRRVVTERPLGLDYSDEGSIQAEEFEDIFEQEDYSRLPDYLQEAVEAAVLGYYENKDIRHIDYEIDRIEAAWRVRRACELNSVFALSLSRLRIDLYNIRTMLRLKMAERDERQFFFSDGYVDCEKFIQGLEIGYEAIAPLFYATPYAELLDDSVTYLRNEQSFLRLEQRCEDHLMGFLKTTHSLAAGPQPVMAYMLMKEAEIRTVRMILVGKKNSLSSSLLLDRLGNWM
jgi:V/A-type H+-transporting ATPase subunit C